MCLKLQYYKSLFKNSQNLRNIYYWCIYSELEGGPEARVFEKRRKRMKKDKERKEGESVVKSKQIR